jgi:hypothetical protein
MSRNPINDDIGLLGRAMDVLTIDASRLQIPSTGVRGKPRPRGVDVRFAAYSAGHERDASRADPTEAPAPALGVACSASKRDDVVIDIRTKVEQKSGAEVQALLETPVFAVPVGYLVFCLALAMCNLLQPVLAHAICIALSPLPMLCILAHAVGVQPVWIGWGLTICGWLAPSICALWSVWSGVCYLACVSVLAFGGCRRVIPGLCMLVVVFCSCMALNPHLAGLEPKIWITVEAAFAALTCASAYAGGGKVICRVKNIQ